MFLKVTLSVLAIAVLLTLAGISFRLIFKIVNALLRPVLMGTWSWCFKRNIPFPNLWEGPEALVWPSLATAIVWTILWTYLGIASYPHFMVWLKT